MSRAHPVLVASALVWLGCSAVGHHRVAGPDVESVGAPDRPRVLLVVVDGLRSDALVDYLRLLRGEDWAPEWHSGLALLGTDGFALAPSTRAESPLPAGGLAAAATLVTGVYPDEHGVPGNRFVVDGARYDFEGAADAGRIYFDDAYQRPGAEGTPLTRMLRRPTLYERLSGRRTAVVFHPFARGATAWYVPDDVGATVTALLPDETGAAATPLLDEGARAAATKVLLADDPPDVLTIGLRGVLTESCFQPDADCNGARGDLAAVQGHALRLVDGHLWRLLRKYRAARPEAYAATTVLLVGTGGVVDRRGNAPKRGAHGLDAHDVVTRLAERSDAACAAWWREGAVGGDLRVAANGASLHLSVGRAPRGQQHRTRRALECVDAALRATLEDEGWLGGAAWLPPDALGLPGPRAARVEARLQPIYAGTLPVHRRERALRKMRRAFDDGTDARTGQALLFAAAPWHFVGQVRGRRPAATVGGLEDGAVGAAFLVAGRALGEPTVTALRTTPVELADVAPTVLALVSAPEAAFDGLDRPPVLRREGDTIVLRRADRQIALRAWKPAPATTWSEDDEEVRIGLVEPQETWPPESVTLRWGDQRWTWRGDGGWADGAPCDHSERDGRRSWSCEAPVDRASARLVVAATRRDPAPEGQGAAFTSEAVVIGDAVPRLTSVELKCASTTEARLRVEADDALGLASVALEVVDTGEVAAATRRTTTVGAMVAKGCADPLAEACTYEATARRVDGPVTVPFAVALLSHQVDAARLRAPRREAREAMRSASGLVPTPQDAYVRVRVCNLAGRCLTRPLASDTTYAAAVVEGCGP